MPLHRTDEYGDRDDTGRALRAGAALGFFHFPDFVYRGKEVKRDSSLRRFYTIDAKNTSDECNLNSSQLTLEPLRGAVQTRCTQKARIGESP